MIVLWYGEGGGVTTGPYKTPEEAWFSLLLTEKASREHNSPYPKDGRVFPLKCEYHGAD